MAFKDEVGSLDRIAKAVEEIAESGADLPTPAIGDAGKVLGVDNEGKWELVSDSGSDLPTPAIGDAGKVLGVDDEGKWELASGGGGGTLLVQSSMEEYIETLDCTWKEIRDAALGGRPVFLKYYVNDEEYYDALTSFYIYPVDPPDQNGYACNFVSNGNFSTNEENGYPSADRS